GCSLRLGREFRTSRLLLSRPATTYRATVARLRGEPMLDFMAEQQCQSVGIDPPHERSDAEQRALVRNQLQLHRGPGLQQCFRSDFRTMRADVHGTCHVSVRPYLDENGPRHAGSRMVPSVLLSWNRHE